MADQQRVIKAILSLSYDTKSLAGTRRAIAQLQADLEATKKRTLSFEDATKSLKSELLSLARQDAIDKIGRDMAQAGAEGRNFNDTMRQAVTRLQAVGASEDEVRAVARAFRESATAANQAANAAERASVANGGGPFERLKVFGRELRALPAVGIPGAGGLSTDAIAKIAQTTGAGLTALGATTVQLAQAAGLAAPALVLLGVAVQGFAKIVEDGKRSLDAALDAQERYYTAVEELTTTEARALIVRINRSNEILEQQIAETQGAVNDAFAAQASENGDLSARILDSFGVTSTAQLQERLNELEKEFNENQNTVARLTQGLGLNAFAFNDAAEAAEELAEKQRLSTQQTREWIAEFKPDVYHASRDALEQFNAGIVSVTDAAADAGSKLLSLGQAAFNEFTSGAQDAAAPFLDRVAETRKRQEQLNTQLQREMSVTGANLLKTQQDIIAAEKDLAETRDKAAQRIANIRTELIAEEAQIRQEADDALNKLSRDYGVERLESAEDYEIALAAIQRRFRNDTLDAQGERDALAALQAQQQKRDETQEEKQQYSLEERRRKDAYNRAVVDLALKTSRELQIAQQGAQREIELATQQANAELAIKQQGYNLALQQAALFAQQLAALFQMQTGTPVPNGQILVPNSQTISNEDAFRLLGIRGYAKGGRYAPNEPFIAGEGGKPELIFPDRGGRVYNNRDTKRMMDGVNLTLMVDGVTVSTAKKVSASTALDTVVDIFNKYGAQ